MGFFRRTFGFLWKKQEQPEVDSNIQKDPADVKNCPFCWGYQEFGNQSRTMGHDKQIDVKNHRDINVKVGKFMVEHVDGFKNKKRVIERCPKCGGKKIRYIENS